MRMNLYLAVLAVALLLAASMPLIAHHAFGSEFDPNRPVLLKGKGGEGRMGKSPHLDPRGSHESGWQQGSLDDRRRKPELTAPARRDERLAPGGNRDRRRWLSDAGPHAQAGERPQCDVSGRPQAESWLVRTWSAAGEVDFEIGRNRG